MDEDLREISDLLTDLQAKMSKYQKSRRFIKRKLWEQENIRLATDNVTVALGLVDEELRNDRN